MRLVREAAKSILNYLTQAFVPVELFIDDLGVKGVVLGDLLVLQLVLIVTKK